MTRYLGIEDLLYVASQACGRRVQVRDYGLLEAALARPAATVFGSAAYPSLHTKAAALLHSLACNHALVDGNKRLAWAACAVFLGINGQRPHATQDEVVDFVVSVADGTLADVEKIAERLATWSRLR
ncbi:MAG: type II toxin-antitoxin system death-on-curing family toxin [Pseudonocardiaceae bacterium]